MHGVQNDTQRNNMKAWPTSEVPFGFAHGEASSIGDAVIGVGDKSQNKTTGKWKGWMAVSRIVGVSTGLPKSVIY